MLAVLSAVITLFQLNCKLGADGCQAPGQTAMPLCPCILEQAPPAHSFDPALPLRSTKVPAGMPVVLDLLLQGDCATSPPASKHKTLYRSRHDAQHRYSMLCCRFHSQDACSIWHMAHEPCAVQVVACMSLSSGTRLTQELVRYRRRDGPPAAVRGGAVRVAADLPAPGQAGHGRCRPRSRPCGHRSHCFQGEGGLHALSGWTSVHTSQESL